MVPPAGHSTNRVAGVLKIPEQKVLPSDDDCAGLHTLGSTSSRLLAWQAGPFLPVRAIEGPGTQTHWRSRTMEKIHDFLRCRTSKKTGQREK